MDHTTPKEPRPPINLRIKFRSESLEQFIERYAMDVSRGGIFIRTKEPLAVGTPLKLDFQFQNGTPLMAGDGTVVWIREFDANRTNVPPGMGVRFDKLTPESQGVLEQLLSDKSKRDRAGASGAAAAGAGMAVRRPSSMFSALEAQVQVGDAPSGDQPAPAVNRPATASQPPAGHVGAAARAPFSAATPLTGDGARSPATAPSSSGTLGSSPKPGGIGGFRHLTPNESSVPDDDISDEPTQIAGRLPSFLTSDEEATAVGNSPLESDSTDKLVERSPFGARHADAASPHAGRLADRAGPRRSSLDEAPPSPGATAAAAGGEPAKDTTKDLPASHGKEAGALPVTTPALAAITALRSTAVADARAVAGAGGAPAPARTTSPSTSDPAAAEATSIAAGPSTAAPPPARSDKRRSPAALVGVSVIVLGAAAIFVFRFFGSQATESVPLRSPAPATGATTEPTTVSPSPAPSAVAPPAVPTTEPTPAPPPGPSPAGATAATAPPSEPAPAAAAPTEPGHGAAPTNTPPKSGPSSVDVSDTSGASARKTTKHKPTRSTRDQNSDAPAAGIVLPEGAAPQPAAPSPAAPVAAAPSQAAEAAPVPDDGSAAAEAGHQIRVTSRPAGADVALDGQTVGKTPYAGAIQDVTAPHFIAVRKDGFEPFEQMISASSAWSKSKGPKGKPGAQILKINAKLKQVGGAPEAKAAGEGSGPPGEAPAKSDVAKPDRPLPPSDETAPKEGQ